VADWLVDMGAKLKMANDRREMCSSLARKVAKTACRQHSTRYFASELNDLFVSNANAFSVLEIIQPDPGDVFFSVFITHCMRWE
jgi:hypothetical protein